MACCSRRAGKSYGIGYKLLRAGLDHPNSFPLYVTRAREMAKNIIWPALRDISRHTGLELEFKENTGDVVLPNGSRILLRGCDTEREMGKMRGLKYPVAVIDEAQEFGSLLTKLISEVIEPATSDYMGQIYMTGTPNAACVGPFYDAWHATNDMLGWSTHHWTILDNHHHPGKEAYLDEICRQRGWDKNHPSFLREYRGIWIKDENSLVFKDFSSSRNVIQPFTPSEDEEWIYVLGCDVGFNDPTAYVVMAYSQQAGAVHVLESYEDSEVTPGAFAAEVEALNQAYDFSAIVIDTGGIGKGYAEELKEKYGIDFIPAQKQNRLGYIKLLNGDFKTGLVRVTTPNAKLIEDIQHMQWDLDKKAKGRWVFDDKSDKNDHLVDALLYGWRYCYHQNLDWREQGPTPGSREAMDKQLDEYWEQLGLKMEQAKHSPTSHRGNLSGPST